jgi:hypothetical protein
MPLSLPREWLLAGCRDRQPKSHLDFYIADFVRGSDDRSADHRGEDVRREIGAGVAALDELQRGSRSENKEIIV